MRARAGLLLVIFSVCLVCLAGCAAKVPVNMLKPARHHEAAMARTVAVLPFEGREGQEFASEIESVLGSITLDGKPYFTLVERASLDKIISELKFSQSGLVDSGRAAELGKMVGAQGIYTGTVRQNFKSTSYQDNREECQRHEEPKDSKFMSKLLAKCLEYRRWTVNCTKNVLNLTCNPKLIEVQTGRVIYTENINVTVQDDKCDDRGAVLSRGELLLNARAQVKKRFRQDIAPYYETRMVQLMDSTDGISSQQAADNLAIGITWAQNKRMDKACELWAAFPAETAKSYAVAFNLGVCAESRADYENACKLYRKSEDLLRRPDEEITAAIARASASARSAKKLSEQMKAGYQSSAPAVSSLVDDEVPAGPSQKRIRR